MKLNSNKNLLFPTNIISALNNTLASSTPSITQLTLEKVEESMFILDNANKNIKVYGSGSKKRLIATIQVAGSSIFSFKIIKLETAKLLVVLSKGLTISVFSMIDF